MEDETQAWQRAVARVRAELASQPSQRLVCATLPTAEMQQRLLEHEEVLRQSGAWLSAMDAILALGSVTETGRGSA